MAKPKILVKMEQQAEKGEFFLYEVDKKRRIATISFNKPEKLNALNLAEFRKLADLIEEIQWDPDVKVVILKGIGRAFGVGGDQSTAGMERGLTDEKGKPIYDKPPQWRQFGPFNMYVDGPRGIIQALTYCTKATIAQVHGYCYGGHMCLAMACDITIASEEAIFAHAGYRYMGPSAEGLLAPWFLNVGVKKTMELMLTGRPFSAEEAERIGVVNQAVPLEELEKEVQRNAEAIALLSLDGIVMGKYASRLFLDRMGYGGITAVVAHGMGGNVKWEKGDFNVYKERRDRGLKGSFRVREARYAKLGMDIDTVRAEVSERLARKRQKK